MLNTNSPRQLYRIDFLIAAAAEAAGPEVVLWCFDRDLRVICDNTDQPCEAEDSAGPGR